jgi:hypothetical protein
LFGKTRRECVAKHERGDTGEAGRLCKQKKAANWPDCCHWCRRPFADPVRRVGLESCEYPCTSLSSSPHSSPWHQPLTQRNAFHLRVPSGLRIQDPTRRGGYDCLATREQSVGLPGVQQTSRLCVSGTLQILRAERFTKRLTVEPEGRRYARAAGRKRQQSMRPAKGRPDQRLKTPSCQLSAGRSRFSYGPAGRCTSIPRGKMYLRRASALGRRSQRNDGVVRVKA